MSRLPNLAGTINGWKRPRTVKTVTRQTTDFERDDTVTARTIQAMVQVADKNKLSTNEQIDWSKQYILIHTTDSVENGELIEYAGEDHKIISVENWADYGFMKATGEQTNRPLVQST